ncbi:MAG TPA: hypothetical protein VGQ83_36120 [Polyangia bacterium]|jgi:hypothetical protein
MRKTVTVAVALVVAAAAASLAVAADHADGTPAALNQPDPSSDITDLFAWMTPDAARLNLIMDVSPGATAGTQFSDAVKYVFFLGSRPGFGDPVANRVQIIATFDAKQVIQLWVRDAGTGTVLDYVTGDASKTSGLTSRSGKVKVFAGLRDDPFFFNLAGFKNAARAVARVTAPATDAAGCPTVGAAAVAAVTTLLQKDCTGTGAPVDTFAAPTPGSNAKCPSTNPNQPLTGNILAIVVQLDKTLVTQGGPSLVFWGSTNK